MEYVSHATHSHANLRNQHRRSARCAVSRQKPEGLQDMVEPGPSPGVYIRFGFQVVKRISRAILVLDLHRNLCFKQAPTKTNMASRNLVL